MPRQKDVKWNIPDPCPGTDFAQLSVLMDIRDELKRLNELLHCPRFMGIPTTLRGIQRKLPGRPKKGAT